MKTEYLRTASNSYMIIKDAEYLFEPYELQMVLRNKNGAFTVHADYDIGRKRQNTGMM